MWPFNHFRTNKWCSPWRLLRCLSRWSTCDVKFAHIRKTFAKKFAHLGNGNINNPRVSKTIECYEIRYDLIIEYLAKLKTVFLVLLILQYNFFEFDFPYMCYTCGSLFKSKFALGFYLIAEMFFSWCDGLFPAWLSVPSQLKIKFSRNQL